MGTLNPFVKQIACYTPNKHSYRAIIRPILYWSCPDCGYRLSHPVCHIRVCSVTWHFPRVSHVGRFWRQRVFVFAVWTVLPNSSSTCLARFFGIVRFIVPLLIRWYWRPAYGSYTDKEMRASFIAIKVVLYLNFFFFCKTTLWNSFGITLKDFALWLQKWAFPAHVPW